MQMVRFGVLAACFLLAASTGSAATVSLDLESSLLFAAPGQSAAFSGVVTNTGAATAFLNGDAFVFPYAIDDTPFFLTVPAILAPGGSAAGPLFTALIPAGAPLGLYVGSFSILGGDNPGAMNVLATETFAVQVIPEPGTFAMFGGSLLLVGWRLRRIHVGTCSYARRHCVRRRGLP
jgi:hypothetical protein